jgi:hypothetical protein
MNEKRMIPDVEKLKDAIRKEGAGSLGWSFVIRLIDSLAQPVEPVEHVCPICFKAHEREPVNTEAIEGLLLDYENELRDKYDKSMPYHNAGIYEAARAELEAIKGRMGL